jgi:hypothetical protein
MDQNKTSYLVQEIRKAPIMAYGHDTIDDLIKIDAYDGRLLATFKVAMIRTHEMTAVIGLKDLISEGITNHSREGRYKRTYHSREGRYKRT